MTDEDLARQIASNPDAAPDLATDIDVRAIRRTAGMTQAQFADAFEFGLRTVQEWERGAKKPSGPLQHHQASVDLLLSIKAAEVLGVVGDEGEVASLYWRHQIPVLHPAKAAVSYVGRLMAALFCDLHLGSVQALVDQDIHPAAVAAALVRPAKGLLFAAKFSLLFLVGSSAPS